eukprot:6192718-Pleurochrysis_carterae.AAC.1
MVETAERGRQLTTRLTCTQHRQQKMWRNLPSNPLQPRSSRLNSDSGVAPGIAVVEKLLGHD